MSETRIVNTWTMSNPALIKAMVRLLWFSIFFAPLCLWHVTSDVYSYFYYGAPAGQIWYVFSKLFGLYAVLLLWYQAVVSLTKNTRHAIALLSWSILRHQYLGGMIFILVLSHIACFVIAVSLRKSEFALGLLLPDFKDFYHTVITLGLFAMFMIVAAMAAALLRQKIPLVWKVIHRVMIVAVSCSLVHGFLIGTETRYGLYQVFYCLLMITLAFSLFIRIRSVRRVEV